MVARLGLIILLAACSLPSAFAADDDNERRIAAERYLQVADVPKMMRDMTRNMAQTLPESQREGFQRLMSQHVRLRVVEDLMLGAMQKHFTPRELNAMADFYGSPEGRAILDKFGPYMADIMPGIQGEMGRAMAEYKRASKSRAKPGGT